MDTMTHRFPAFATAWAAMYPLRSVWPTFRAARGVVSVTGARRNLSRRRQPDTGAEPGGGAGVSMSYPGVRARAVRPVRPGGNSQRCLVVAAKHRSGVAIGALRLQRMQQEAAKGAKIRGIGLGLASETTSDHVAIVAVRLRVTREARRRRRRQEVLGRRCNWFFASRMATPTQKNLRAFAPSCCPI